MVKYLQPTTELIRAVAADMRQADIDEVWAHSRSTPLQSLEKSMDVTDFSAIVEIDGTPCAMIGLRKGSILVGDGVPWLLSTNAALNHRREFLRQSKPAVAEMLDVCPYLYNHVYTENKLSIRWLRWAGFTIDPPLPTGYNGELFHKFHMTKAEYNV